ncbi:MAG TPA: hypothetical protein VFV13_08035 [Acidimicrobiia bacterium]|nr:hypothetical protein [Acidimicrobiia bacterium]
MFVRHESEVALPLSEVERRIDVVRSDLGSMANVAYREGEELRARVGPGAGAVAKEVRLVIGTPEIHRSGLIYPVSWSAIGSENLFPHLTADLILSHVGHDRTRIVLDGTYQPPLGPLGKVMDRALLRHVAESTVRTWTDRLAESLVAGVR